MREFGLTNLTNTVFIFLFEIVWQRMLQLGNLIVVEDISGV